MTIGFDAKRAFHNYTGLGNYSRFIIGALQQYYPEDHYYLYTPSQKINPETVSLMERGIVKEPEGIFKKFKSLWRSVFLFKFTRRDGLDIYHGLSNELPWAGGKSVKKVVTIHDLIFLRYPELFNPIDRLIYNWKFKKACRKADLIVAVSGQTKKDIIHFYNIEDKKIRVVYQGYHPVFETNYTAQNLQDVKKKYSLPDRYILNVGTLEKRKNALLILRALKHLKTPIPVVFVGKATAYKKELLQFITENRLENYVHFRHEVAFQDLPALYHNSTLFVYPSVFEGFGIPLIEAQQCGIPVITSLGSCFREVGGESVRYIDSTNHEALAEAIGVIVDDEALRHDMITGGRQNIERYTQKKIATDLHEIYRELLNTAKN